MRTIDFTKKSAIRMQKNKNYKNKNINKLYKLNKKSQAAIEYMSVVMISLMLISGVAYFFMMESSSMDDELLQGRVNEIGTNIRNFAQEAHYSTGVYRKTIRQMHIPQEVVQVYAQDEHQIVFETRDGRFFTYHSDVPVYGYVNTSVHTGEVIVENVGGSAIFCTTPPCSCDDIPDVRSCYDDHVYWYHGCGDRGEVAVDCGEDSCAYNWGCHDVNTRNMTCYDVGCHASSCYNNSYEHTEPCQQGYECHLGECTFIDCYVESFSGQDGYGDCDAGYTPLLSLRERDNSHVVAPGRASEVGFGHDICCEERAGALDFSCETQSGSCSDGETRVFGFVEGLDLGSHVEFGVDHNDFDDSLCCSVDSSAGDLECELRDDGCGVHQSSFGSLQRAENSHLGAPGEHEYDVCCWVEP